MPDRYHILTFPTPTLALQALAEFAGSDATRAAALGRARLSAETPLYSREAPARVYWPFDPRGSDRQWQALYAVYERLMGEAAIPQDEAPPKAQPAAAGLATLLLRSDPGRASGRADDPPRTDNRLRLLIVPDLDVEAAAALFLRLQLLATQTRAARHEATGRAYQLYYLVDDPARDSAADYLPTDELAGGVLLRGFPAGASGRAPLIFVPAGVVPGEAAREAYGRVMLAAPGLFGLAGAPAAPEVLAAIVPDGRDGYLHLHLAGLHFHDDWQIAPRREIGPVEVAGLAETPRAMERLSAALAAARPRLGYRLRLVRSRDTAYDEHLIERLEQEQLAISERIADLRGFAKGRPRLLRFGPAQLPALADLLRFFPPRELSNLLYGFHARPDGDAGGHFLLIPHEQRHLLAVDPLRYWARAEGPTIDFWLEPNFTRDYWPQNHHMLFVPHGRTLTPPLHSWAVGSMDEYLRQTAGTLREDAARRAGRVFAPLPATPLYVMDGQEEDISLTVIDRAAFRPLHATLPWLNDNLRLMDTWGGAQAFIERLSAEAGRARLAARSTGQAAQATRELDALIDSSDARAAAGLDGLLSTLTEEIARLAGEGETLVAQAQALNAELEAIRAFHAAMQQEVSRTRQAIEQTTGAEVDQLQAHYRGLIDRVEGAITQSRRTRDTLGRKVDDMVGDLVATGQRLRQRLDVLRREGR